jgi:hypothetical protein
MHIRARSQRSTNDRKFITTANGGSLRSLSGFTSEIVGRQGSQRTDRSDLERQPGGRTAIESQIRQTSAGGFASKANADKSRPVLENCHLPPRPVASEAGIAVRLLPCKRPTRS